MAGGLAQVKQYLQGTWEARGHDLAPLGAPPLRRAARRVYWLAARRVVRVGGRRRRGPLVENFGFSRGRPVDRVYLDWALDRHRGVVRGRVLEVGDRFVADTFGDDRVGEVDVLHIDPDAPGATIIADLADAPAIPDDTYDTVVALQTIHLIYDFHAAIATMHRVLRPGGTALVTFPGITPFGDEAWGDEWLWGFTHRSAQRMFGDVFGDDVTVEAHGNYATAVAFLSGLTADDLRPRDYPPYDPRYEIVIVVVARKAERG